MKLLKTTLYYYCLPDRFKKQISTYVCETIEETNKSFIYKDTNGVEYYVLKEDLNLTIFKGLVDASYSIVFENVSEELDLEKAERTICEDSTMFLTALADFSNIK